MTGEAVLSIPGSVLQTLLGDEAPEEFLSNFWQRKPWIGHGALPPLTDPEELEEYVALGRLAPDAIRIYQSGVPVDPSKYCMSTTQGLVVVRPDKIVDFFFEGGTLVLESLHFRFPRIGRFCQRLATELGQPTQANAYYAPSHAVAFPLHHDTHDVFVLQLAGSKNWRIHSPVVQCPLPEMTFDRETMDAGPVVMETSLSAGDVMYLPRGWIHEAETGQDMSLHLTVGVLVYTWRDDLQAVLQQVARELPQFRQAAGEGSVGDLLQAIARMLDGDQVQTRIQERIVQAANPTAAQRFRDVRLSPTINATTWLSRRIEVPAALAVNSAAVSLLMPERTLTLPVRLAPLLADIISSETPFRVGDLTSDLSEQSRLSLVRRLVREGMLEVTRRVEA